ncbi:MAG TPA: Spy/CpxP family protein refolding chaperone [Terriglobales bacterium]|nr:Spy/CpxP family protein refolding chaperone [Terriglobales bacterium]
MKSRTAKIMVGVLAITLLGALAVSQTLKRAHMHHDGMFGEHMLGFMTDYLGLSSDQQSQVKQIMDKEKSSMKPLFSQMQQGHQAMRQLIESGAFDEAKAREIATQQSQNLVEMEVQKARMFSEIYQVLTPDQRTKAKQFLDRHEERMQKHMQDQPRS